MIYTVKTFVSFYYKYMQDPNRNLKVVTVIYKYLKSAVATLENKGPLKILQFIAPCFLSHKL